MKLEEIKQVEFEILKHFKKYCEDNNIQYFLSNGTLLGAVKYKGFIPWDDDIDVFIPRQDYNRFIEEYVDSSIYKLFSPERINSYRFPFAKLCDMSTRKIEWNNNNGVELGLDIDVFPLDMWNGEYSSAQRQVRRQEKFMTMLRLSKNQIISSPKLHKSVIKKLVANFCKYKGAAYFVKKLQDGANRENDIFSNAGCVVWPVYGEHEIIPAEVFHNTVKVSFEGEEFPAPAGYDEYLRSLYGNYEEDPPLDKQKSHHRFTAYYL